MQGRERKKDEKGITEKARDRNGITEEKKKSLHGIEGYGRVWYGRVGSAG